MMDPDRILVEHLLASSLSHKNLLNIVRGIKTVCGNGRDMNMNNVPFQQVVLGLRPSLVQSMYLSPSNALRTKQQHFFAR